MYEPIYYWNPDEFDKFPCSDDKIGGYLSVAHYSGHAMLFWVVPQQIKLLQDNYVYIPRTMVRGLLIEDIIKP